MNQTQIKYARERAKEIFNKRKQDLQDEYTVPSKLLSDEEKLKALKAGKFKVSDTKTVRNTYWKDWNRFVTFDDEVLGGLDTAKYDAAYSKLKDDLTKINDELVLGDNEKALALLAEFDKD